MLTSQNEKSVYYFIPSVPGGNHFMIVVGFSFGISPTLGDNVFRYLCLAREDMDYRQPYPQPMFSKTMGGLVEVK
jgi:hypothetical protein